MRGTCWYWLGFVAAVFLWFSVEVMTTAYEHSQREVATGLPTDHRPDLSKCPTGKPVWDCIRHALYASEET